MTRTVEVPEFVIYHTGDEWAALYADGKLVSWNGSTLCGDSYHIDEFFYDLLGVKVIYDSAFLQGGTSRSGCAETIEQIEDFIAERARLLARAEELEAEVVRLRSEAASLRGAPTT